MDCIDVSSLIMHENVVRCVGVARVYYKNMDYRAIVMEKMETDLYVLQTKRNHFENPSFGFRSGSFSIGNSDISVPLNLKYPSFPVDLETKGTTSTIHVFPSGKRGLWNGSVSFASHSY